MSYLQNLLKTFHKNVKCFHELLILPWWKRLSASITCRAVLAGDKNLL